VQEDYPDARHITLVMDNLNTHTGASLYKAFAPEVARALLDKLEFVYTPKHGSWLNMAECEFSVLSRQCLARRIPDIETVATEITAWVAESVFPVFFQQSLSFQETADPACEGAGQLREFLAGWCFDPHAIEEQHVAPASRP
jgi:transposase